jgi:integrase
MDRTALSPLLRSFERHLRAANRSERTIASYLESLRQAEAFLAARGKGLADARRADLEAFLADLLTRRAAGTVATRYKVLRILYGWLEEEDEIAANPMARVKPPIVPEQPVPVVPEDGLRRLLATCDGKSFEERRDTALILLLVDVGPRRAELMGLRVSDVDFDLDVLLVLGKGRRERAAVRPNVGRRARPAGPPFRSGPGGAARFALQVRRGLARPARARAAAGPARRCGRWRPGGLAHAVGCGSGRRVGHGWSGRPSADPPPPARAGSARPAPQQPEQQFEQASLGGLVGQTNAVRLAQGGQQAGNLWPGRTHQIPHGTGAEVGD